MLSAQDIRRFQERLRAEREAVESRIAGNREGVKQTVRDADGVGDFEDEATLLYQREADLDETARDQQELAQIEKALARIEQGTYGTSEVSGKPIPIERLEALPTATTLVGERVPGPE